MSSKLAIQGGPAIRRTPIPDDWPVHGDLEEQLLLDALRTGKWGRGQGEKVERFEKAFAEHHQCRYGLGVNNGTIALKIALLAAGIEEGDEVIVPPFTFQATASAVIEANATPVFVDIERDTYNIDPVRIEEAITPRTKAVIPVHIAGLAADMEAITRIARKHGLLVIEDAAHAHGGIYKGRRLGSFGDMACFSMQWSKNITAGEGGAIITNNEELYTKCWSIHNCGRVPEGAWYDHHNIGGNYRMNEFQAALLIGQLSRLDEQNRKRTENGRDLVEKLDPLPGVRPLKIHEDQSIHPYHLFYFDYNEQAFDGLSRQDFSRAMEAEGFPVAPTYQTPLNRQPMFANKQFGPYTGYRHHRPDLDFTQFAVPVCEEVCRVNVRLPHPVLLAERADMDDIVRGIEKVYEHRHELLADGPRV